ncbi:MAG: hypothetical protein LKE33_02405 [Acidaminococcus sp.]|jgi:hypothetical protein|nr:hypothetical protein [Acidaminococcus sp.]MCI2101083.1 hypothetical protein [Acidaminococcus sp.]MCI2115486.1 hypothetical protein [Acidaminococcus sp.]MCI2117608.1 hypothetical protein [Acidaminococcus sp.]
MLKKLAAILFACALLIMPGTLHAQESDTLDTPDPDWQLVNTAEAGHTWELDRSVIMQRGTGRVAGYREMMPDKSYKLTLALFSQDHRMAPIMKLSVTADNTITDRWRAKEEEWTTIEAGTPLDKVYQAVWAAKVTQTLEPKK